MQSASGGNHGSRSWRMGLCAEPASAPCKPRGNPPMSDCLPKTALHR
ncbi:hypothetical protein [Moorena producens]|nr:hypothetical protein [Moorena producens]